MNKSTKKNYIRGSAKRVSFSDGGEVLNLDLNLQDLNSLPVSDRGYVKIVVARRRSPDTYGNTDYVYENTFVPDKTKGSKAPTNSGPSVGFGPQKAKLPF